MSYKTDLQAINTELEEILEAVNDLPNGLQRSPLPIEVKTEQEMKAILANATFMDVGAVYKYVGETPSIYEKGALYVIGEE